MIPFNEMDQRLKKLEKDRTWLSQVSGRKPDSIRVALAKNAPASKRSPLIQKALSDAIEREEAARRGDNLPPSPAPALPDNITLIVGHDRRLLYEQAASESPQKFFTPWAIAELDKAAAAWAATKPRNVEQEIQDRCITPPGPSDDSRLSSYVNEEPEDATGTQGK